MSALRPQRSPSRAAQHVLAGVALACGAASCVFVKSAPSHDWNLGQLHYPSGAYHYTADLVDDFEYVMRSGTSTWPLKASIQNPLGADKEPVPNPAEATLENLLDLAKFDDDDERIAGIQTLWFARLATQDPSQLARERCVLELARLGQRVSIDLPVPIPPDAEVLGPEALGELLTALIREYRLALEQRPVSPGQLANLDASCREIEESAYDLDGGRRILFAVNSLVRGVKRGSEERAPLDRLSRAAQRVCIEQALAVALGDDSPVVRAAAVRSAVEAVGLEVIVPILLQLNREPSLEVPLAVMDLIAERGLPDPPPGMDEATYLELRENWILVLYDTAVNQPDGHLQVQAMAALRTVLPPGVPSLRDEDWVDWWLARDDAIAAGKAP